MTINVIIAKTGVTDQGTIFFFFFPLLSLLHISN